MTDTATAEPTIERRQHGRNHSYRINGDKVPGVTTIIGSGLPKPALVAWGPKVVAEYVADRLTVTDGHVHADQLVTDLAALARSKSRPFPEDSYSPTRIADTLKGVHWEDRDQAANRGTDVHRIAEQLARGETVDVPEPLAGHVDAYLQFLEDWQPTDAHLEVVVANATHRYCGTLDMLATIPGLGRCLIDLKTNRSGPFAEVALQLAGYRYAEWALIDDATVPMPEVDWCGVCWLRADGYDLIPYTAGPAEYRMFRYVQQVGGWLDHQSDPEHSVRHEALNRD